MITRYKPIKLKINHPWWHWIFTGITNWGSDGSYEVHYCSRCEKYYHFDAEEAEVVKNESV